MAKVIEETANSVKIELSYPLPSVNGEGEEIRELTIGRLKAKHFKSMPEKMLVAEEGAEISLSPVEMLPVIASITGITEAQADELDMEDIPVVAEAVTNFFERYQETGKS
jgi:hypothetical protein